MPWCSQDRLGRTLKMAYNIFLCLLLMTTSFQYVTSYTVHRRHSRTSGLAEALRMLERQRRRSESEENFIVPSPQLVREGAARIVDADDYLTNSASSSSETEIGPAWMAQTLGVDSSSLIEQSPDDIQIGEFLEKPVQPSAAEVDLTDMEPSFEESNGDQVESHSRVDKKDKEVMTNIVGDARPKVHTRSSDNVMDTVTSDEVSVARDDFKALLRAVEKIQEEAVQKAEEEEEEAEEVMEEVQEKIAEAREEAKEEAAEEEAESEIVDPDPLLESGEGLDNLIEEQSEEVIPTDNGEIVRVETTLRDEAGEPVGWKEVVEQVETSPRHSPLPPDMMDLWSVKNYIDEENKRRKRNSKRNTIPASLMKELPAENYLLAELVQAYVKKVNELERDLGQAEAQSYLEDVENDLLTQALDQAAQAQLQPGRLPLRELSALRDAIRVEGMIQEVKADRLLDSDLSEEMADEISADLGSDENEKRGEPWRKRSDGMPPEVPVFFMSEGNDVIDDVGDDRKGTTALAVKDPFDEDDEEDAEDPFVPISDEDEDLEVDSGIDDLMGESMDDTPGVASLFSDDADQCPAVQAFSTNCRFAGANIDFEARALCNLHEMCYICGRSLEMHQAQCDFIYRAASSMLCESDRQCALEAEVFLNAMKLKHRFVPYQQPLCRAPCAARFLSLI